MNSLSYCALSVAITLSAMSVSLPSASAQGPSKGNKGNAQPPVRAADSDAPLAEGWPGGTAPGTIEVKKYPTYRSAVASAKNVGMNGLVDGILFMSLFNHIDRNEIAMTTPVVNNFPTVMLEEKNGRGDMTMEFVYRSQKLGSTGPGTGSVQVMDHPAATYVCLGLQGNLNPKDTREGIAKLQAWLDEHKTEWTAAGNPRRLGYHGPMTPPAERLWEVQIPIKPVTTDTNTETQAKP